MSLKRQTRRAFTLIELLVVIAIIAILAAILFPVFAQAKAAAKQAVSVSNTKQQMLGLQMYINDYDDTAFLPWEMGVYPVQLEYPYTKNLNITWDAGSPIPNFPTPMVPLPGGWWGSWTLVGTLSWSQQGLEYASQGPNQPRVFANQANPANHAVLLAMSNPNQPLNNWSFGNVVPGDQGWFTFDGWNEACNEPNGTLADWENVPQQGITRAANLWHTQKYVTGYQDGHAKVVADESYINPTTDCANQTAAWYYANINPGPFPNYNNLQPVNAWGAWMIQPKHLQYWGAWWDPSE
jgi:prepilin-type N-terminal cleavage/methylation domain-containing protein